jgi:hypothetical protein
MSTTNLFSIIHLPSPQEELEGLEDEKRERQNSH